MGGTGGQASEGPGLRWAEWRRSGLGALDGARACGVEVRSRDPAPAPAGQRSQEPPQTRPGSEGARQPAGVEGRGVGGVGKGVASVAPALSAVIKAAAGSAPPSRRTRPPPCAPPGLVRPGR